MKFPVLTVGRKLSLFALVLFSSVFVNARPVYLGDIPQAREWLQNPDLSVFLSYPPAMKNEIAMYLYIDGTENEWSTGAQIETSKAVVWAALNQMSYQELYLVADLFEVIAADGKIAEARPFLDLVASRSTEESQKLLCKLVLGLPDVDSSENTARFVFDYVGSNPSFLEHTCMRQSPWGVEAGVKVIDALSTYDVLRTQNLSLRQKDEGSDKSVSNDPSACTEEEIGKHFNEAMMVQWNLKRPAKSYIQIDEGQCHIRGVLFKQLSGQFVFQMNKSMPVTLKPEITFNTLKEFVPKFYATQMKPETKPSVPVSYPAPTPTSPTGHSAAADDPGGAIFIPYTK